MQFRSRHGELYDRQLPLTRSRKKAVARALCFSVTAVLALVVASCSRCYTTTTRDENTKHGTRPPNVLFIAVDDLASSLGCYGDLVAKTPHIDRLAATGVCFRRAYNQLPLCNPTRASVMTGLRPTRSRFTTSTVTFRAEVPNVVTLSQAVSITQDTSRSALARSTSYNVTCVHRHGRDSTTLPHGTRTAQPQRARPRRTKHSSSMQEPHRKISAALSWLAADGTGEEQTDGMIASEAIEILPREERFALLFSLSDSSDRTRTPFVAPKQYFDLYPFDSLRLPFAPPGDRDDIPNTQHSRTNCPVPHYGLHETTLLKATQAYYACVSFVDAQVGRLLKALDELQLADNTIVVFWSDHGYHLGEHNGVWQKRTLFEQSSRAPLIVRAPGQRGRGPCDRVVEFVDIYPTLTDLGDVDAPSGLAGRSLRPLLEISAEADWDGYAVTQVLRPADDRLSEPVMGCSIRTERYRYTEWGEGKHGTELYRSPHRSRRV